MSLRVALSVPADARFARTVRDVAVRFAEVSGCPKADAEHVGRAVDDAISGVMASAGQTGSDAAVDVRLEAEDDRLSVEVRCGDDRRHVRHPITD